MGQEEEEEEEDLFRRGDEKTRVALRGESITSERFKHVQNLHRQEVWSFVFFIQTSFEYLVVQPVGKCYTGRASYPAVLSCLLWENLAQASIPPFFLFLSPSAVAAGNKTSLLLLLLRWRGRSDKSEMEKKEGGREGRRRG